MAATGLLATCARRGVTVIAVLLALPGQPEAQERRYVDLFAGQMTTNKFYQAVDPTSVDFADSWFLGAGFGWERPIGASRFDWGLQAQIVGHAGRQDHFEVNVPVIIRYRPRDPWPRWVESTAFGIGVSHATKTPQVEIDRRGESSRSFVYWMAEIEIAHPRPGSSVIARLHHRSDGYGLYDAEGGSSALVIGWRMSF
ncbi:hypothetical protein [Sulfitobacter sabulilitoris]|uniref:Acyloxyacyl hydrolase n=1 Tax=Sulfitobacter sabulilitoris TaxID=2562655 RepID=A0A5S3QBQ7_9RHOB|nr:hypothetical protein [Sulfitobacter sabulilitoris]TMM54512.1 hypothetical protein FDT80_02650 [Sulfitobacter sabulilitoris]